MHTNKTKASKYVFKSHWPHDKRTTLHKTWQPNPAMGTVWLEVSSYCWPRSSPLGSDDFTSFLNPPQKKTSKELHSIATKMSHQKKLNSSSNPTIITGFCKSLLLFGGIQIGGFFCPPPHPSSPNETGGAFGLPTLSTTTTAFPAALADAAQRRMSSSCPAAWLAVTLEKGGSMLVAYTNQLNTDMIQLAICFCWFLGRDGFS